jgi:hypothetical protein
VGAARYGPFRTNRPKATAILKPCQPSFIQEKRGWRAAQVQTARPHRSAKGVAFISLFSIKVKARIRRRFKVTTTAPRQPSLSVALQSQKLFDLTEKSYIAYLNKLDVERQTVNLTQQTS